MRKLFSIILAAALISVTATGCSGTKDNSGSTGSQISGSIAASGSSALYPLVKDAKTKFQKTYKNVSISLNAGGSGVGLQNVADGTVDIGNSDVEASTKLKDAAQIKSLVDHKVCVIGVAAVVNSDVTVKNLTTDQLIAIFTGKTKNWKDVGGADEAITLVTRPATSGTLALFKQYALNGNEEVSNASLETDDSGTLLANVTKTKGSIGYVALSYLVNNAGVKTVSIDGVEPSLDTVYSGSYKVWGYEHMYTRGEAKGAVKAFIDYMQSSEYATSMETLGYNVTSKMKTTR